MAGERQRYKIDCPGCGKHGQVVLEDGEIEHATGGFEVVGKLGLKCEDCGAKVTYGATPKAKPAKTKFKAKAKARR